MHLAQPRRFAIFGRMTTTPLPTDLLDRCRDYLRAGLRVDPQARLMLAVSGGMDSVLLCHLMHQLGQPFEVAHCHFQLRGEASDGDATFVGQLARTLDVPYHEVRFDTRYWASTWGVSIQVAARRLRYSWLSDLRRMQHCALIATGHHLDDGIETALFQWVRGCGVRGLHGIPARTEEVIRPLGILDRQTIQATIQAVGIPYREDASNAEVKYTRNRLRHHVVPELRRINPSLSATMRDNFERMQQTEAVLDWAVAHWKQQLWSEREGYTIIAADRWAEVPAPELVAYEWLRDWGFTAGQVRDMLSPTGQAAGRTFESETHVLLVNRTEWIVRPLGHHAVPAIELVYAAWPDAPIDLGNGCSLHWRLVPAKDWTPQSVAYVCAMDAARIEWPLTIRRWRKGDRLAPLGMGGQHKKVSQLLKDLKYSLYDKEAVQVLCWGERIAWVLGIRMSEDFKVTPNTAWVLELTLVC